MIFIFWTKSSLSWEKAMASHSSTLAWKIPWMEEPGRLQSTELWKESDMTKWLHFHALEKEMATHSSVPAGESQGRRSLVGCHLWGRTESDTTEVTAAAAAAFDDIEFVESHEKSHHLVRGGSCIIDSSSFIYSSLTNNIISLQDERMI